MIVVSHVSKKFGNNTVVNDVSFVVNDGETLVLLGSSGCGKTTTLKMINRLIDVDSGEIDIDGDNILNQNVIALRRRIGYVFQGIGLFPHMTILENVALVYCLTVQCGLCS